MDVRTVFMTLSGLWAVVTIGLLVRAIRICYQIERRSGWRKPGAVPAYAAWIPAILNRGVARDDETQRLRRRMNRLFLLILLLLAAFAAATRLLPES